MAEVFRRKVTKGIPKPVKDHFGESPEFVNKPPSAPKPPARLIRRKPVKQVVKIRP